MNVSNTSETQAMMIVIRETPAFAVILTISRDVFASIRYNCTNPNTRIEDVIRKAMRAKKPLISVLTTAIAVDAPKPVNEPNTFTKLVTPP